MIGVLGSQTVVDIWYPKNALRRWHWISQLRQQPQFCRFHRSTKQLRADRARDNFSDERWHSIAEHPLNIVPSAVKLHLIWKCLQPAEFLR